MRHVRQSTAWPNLVPRAFPTHFLREKPWGRGWAWPVPHACAQPYHPCSGSHGQLSFYLSISLCTDYLSMPRLCYHFCRPLHHFCSQRRVPTRQSHWFDRSYVLADHNSCHKIAFSFLLLWDSVTHRRLFSIPGLTYFILIPEVYKRFSISGLLLWFVLSFSSYIFIPYWNLLYFLQFLTSFNRWTLIVKRLQPP